MPRPKGSKNKTSFSRSIAEQIAAAQAEIQALTAKIKEKKAELKKLEAAEAEEKKAQLLAAVDASGKSIDEVIHLIKEDAASKD